MFGFRNPVIGGGQGARRKGTPSVRGPIECLPEMVENVDGRIDVLQAALGPDTPLSMLQLDQVRTANMDIYILLIVSKMFFLNYYRRLELFLHSTT